MSTQDRLLSHDYDGIQEYDNPMPRWWVWIFWVCIIYAEVYFIYYHLGPGKSVQDSYRAEMAYWDAQLADMAPVKVSEDELMAIALDPERQARGAEIYASKCAACHTADGGGLIGPNMCDDYFIHGPSLSTMHRIVVEGVLAKGMPAWEAQLSPEDLKSVVAYSYNLRGTTPANPKAPEGDLYE